MGFNDFGAKLASRPLEFIWIIDTSTSMKYHGKASFLNDAIRNCIPAMREVASDNVNASILVRAITFATGAFWHIKNRTPVDQFEWVDVIPKGETQMGAAFKLLATELDEKVMPKRGLPPVLVLISDGAPGDNAKKELNELLKLPWARKSVRISIAIGDDFKTEILESFIDNPEIPILFARNSNDLTKYIRWASTQVLNAASATPSNSGNVNSQTSVIVPPPPGSGTPSINNSNDVW